ncbi:uncharacterized protein LOC132167352 [Corylus avellana]|uniref:uncharacterized protein LOC132167352 n=1 Tax=Corylus avellana TaxID=13451 RepID=UPI00286B18AA|nr:uncharacterized protein LOC132167352 [Corylus avellana]
MEIVTHFGHKHMLSLSEKKIEDWVKCDGCNEYCNIGGRIYSCSESGCRFNLEESCAKLPQELHNPLLHPHPLSLVPVQYDYLYCCACGKRCWGCAFRCYECNVILDVKCAFLRRAIEEGEEEAVGTHHFSHPDHPLLLFENMPAHRINCRVCGLWGNYCSDPKTYGCLPCGFFLHPSCFKLPQEIFHPFHPYHPLTLKPPQNSREDVVVRCNACRNDIQYRREVAYDCEWENCRFRLHRECISVIMPSITYQGHDHLLQFNHNIRKNNQFYKLNCSACHSICESYGFSCLYCDFNLHHTCGPLPYTIQHKSHVIHPLILTTSPLEDEEDCEPDEFYCDACEEQRVDPFLPIYYCKECRFVAEISCVISEVVSSLNGEYGDVELRNPLGQFGKVVTKDAAKEMMQKKDQKQLEPTLTWGNYLGTLSEDEKKEKHLLTDRIKETINAEKIEAYDHEEIFSDKAYIQFMKFLNHSGFSNNKFCYPWDLSDHENKEAVVNVRDYMTTRKLAPILNHLLSNHGDIGAQSTLSTPKFKSLFVCMLCKCIDHMRNTMVVNITHDILLDWWTCLKILQLEGFQIDFAFDRLKRVTHAYFGLYVEKEVDNALHQLEKWTRKVKCIKSAKSSLIEECLREASILKKGKAVTSRLL